MATRAEPFFGKKPAQIIRVVLLEEERPQNLLEHCWQQDPEQRLKGFGPVVQALSEVVVHVGDPRGHRAPAVNPIPSLAPKVKGNMRSGGAMTAPRAIPAPPSVSSGGGQRSSVSGSGTGYSSTERGVSLHAMTGGVSLDAPNVDRQIAEAGITPSGSKSAKMLRRMFNVSIRQRIWGSSRTVERRTFAMS